MRSAQGTMRLDALRDRDLQLMLCPITERLLDLAAESVDHGGMVVAENHRSPGELIVDVFIAIHIPQDGNPGRFRRRAEPGLWPGMGCSLPQPATGLNVPASHGIVAN